MGEAGNGRRWRRQVGGDGGGGGGGGGGGDRGRVRERVCSVGGGSGGER